MRFPQLIISLAHELIWNESFLEIFKSCGFNTKDWPEGYPRKAVENYLQMQESNGHLYAQHKLLELSEKLQALLDQQQLPTDPRVLKPLYFSELKKHKAETLGMAIVRNPEKVDELVKLFQEGIINDVSIKPLSHAIEEYLVVYDEKLARGNFCVQIQKFPLLSKMIGGFNPGRVSILLADTGFGKTSLGLQLALSSSELMPTLYLNMEMIQHDFTERAAIAMTGIEYGKLMRGELPRIMIQELAKRKQLFISNGSDLSIEQVRSCMRSQKIKTGLEFVVVDYDQKLILENDGETPEWKALQNAIIGLESISKELDVHTMVLAQQNAEGAISGSRRATFSASTVLKFFNDEKIGDVIQAAKNRFGRRDAAIKVDYKPEIGSIEEVESVYIQKRKEFRP